MNVDFQKSDSDIFWRWVGHVLDRGGAEAFLRLFTI